MARELELTDISSIQVESEAGLKIADGIVIAMITDQFRAIDREDYENFTLKAEYQVSLSKKEDEQWKLNDLRALLYNNVQLEDETRDFRSEDEDAIISVLDGSFDWQFEQVETQLREKLYKD